MRRIRVRDDVVLLCHLLQPVMDVVGVFGGAEAVDREVMKLRKAEIGRGARGNAG